MVDTAAVTTPNPNSLAAAAAPPTLRPPPAIQLPAIRVTSEFDSESLALFNKISCKLLDGFAKLKLSFRNDNKGQISEPQLGFISKNLSLFYDAEDENAFVKASFDFGSPFTFKASHDIKAQQGEVAMIANLHDPAYKFELSSAVPPTGFPKATFRFPIGEVSLEDREEEVSRMLSINGILKSNILNGVCSAQFSDENLKLRYCYKDQELTFIPSISLPSKELEFQFKRQFSPSDKLSYLYNFDSDYWSTVYKHTISKDLKVKAGYDSKVRVGWVSLWIGEGKAKTAPMKAKVQVMVQVHGDDMRSPDLLLQVKKRWDF